MTDQLAEHGSVTLDASGNGTLALKPWGGGVTWWPTTVSVKTSSATLEASAKIYIGPAATDQYFVAATLSGSTGDSTGRVAGRTVDTHGNTLWIVWTGGDVGAEATAVVRGVSTGPGEPAPFDGAVTDSSDFADPLVGGDGTLVYPAIKSPNFVTGSTGWTIKKDGSAEFNNLTIRGSFFGAKFEINSTGAFFYSGTPAAGNLIASIVPGTAAGTDRFGNSYQPGMCVYGGSGQPVVQLYVSGALPTALPELSLLSSRTIENTPGRLVLDVVNTGLVNEWLEQNLFGPSITQRKDYATVHFQSSAKDLSNGALGTLTYVDSSGTSHFHLQWDSGGVHVNATLFGTGGTLTIGDNVDVTGKVISADTWHSLGTLSHFTVTRGRYRMTPEGETELDIHVVGDGANLSSTTFANALPAAYRPASATRRYPLESGRAVTAGDPWPRVEIDTSGNVTVVIAAGVTSAFSGAAKMPLDA